MKYVLDSMSKAESASSATVKPISSAPFHIPCTKDNPAPLALSYASASASGESSGALIRGIASVSATAA